MFVTLENLTIRYGSITAVDQASAEFPPGAVGLLGRNGAGKSSILRALLGLVLPHAGEMKILDFSPSDFEESRRHIGYMSEKDGYIAGLNGFEMVALAGEITGLPRRDAARRAHEVLYLVGLEEQRYREIAGYSAGMRQKVKLGTALVHDPDILFLDEPTNGLDPKGRKEMLGLIDFLAKDLGKSIILSSHILADVERVCHSVVLLEKGRVVAAGPLSELTRHEVRVFVVDIAGATTSPIEAFERHGALNIELSGSDRYRVTLPEDVGVSSLFAAAVDCGAMVHRLVEHKRSLEDVFLGAVKEGVA